MAEYIKLKDALHILDLVMSDPTIKHTGKAIRKRLNELPGEDVVEVVRCKDCKHYVANYCTRDIKGRTNMFYMTENDFCSYGERKEGAEE